MLDSWLRNLNWYRWVVYSCWLKLFFILCISIHVKLLSPIWCFVISWINSLTNFFGPLLKIRKIFIGGLGVLILVPLVRVVWVVNPSMILFTLFLLNCGGNFALTSLCKPLSCIKCIAIISTKLNVSLKRVSLSFGLVFINLNGCWELNSMGKLVLVLLIFDKMIV